MKYVSTRGGVEPQAFQDAVMMGMAADGGLLVPESFPQVEDKLEFWKTLSFKDLAFEIISLFATDIPAEDLKVIIDKSYSTFRAEEVTPAVELKDFDVLELFHGPTLAFKDVALQFLGNVFQYILEKRDQQLNIIGATSGDTGSAAIYGVRGSERIRIFIMHPHGRTSELQRLQMTTVLDENVHNIAIEGTFDDCQALMKSCFNDAEFKNDYDLGAVNSVNWARILAQVVYYFYNRLRLPDDEPVSYCVPTGNFGDIFAGFVAKKMGLPINKLIVATNENNILEQFFNTKEYKRGDVHFTVSPSMDIQVSSNFERYLYYVVGEDAGRCTELMKDFTEKSYLDLRDLEDVSSGCFLAMSGAKAETLKQIKETWMDEGYLLDPHTAVAAYVAKKLKLEGRTVVLSTAHPAKFPAAIKEAVGEDIARHDVLEKIKGLDNHFDILANDYEALKAFMKAKQ